MNVNFILVISIILQLLFGFLMKFLLAEVGKNSEKFDFVRYPISNLQKYIIL